MNNALHLHIPWLFLITDQGVKTTPANAVQSPPFSWQRVEANDRTQARPARPSRTLGPDRAAVRAFRPGHPEPGRTAPACGPPAARKHPAGHHPATRRVDPPGYPGPGGQEPEPFRAQRADPRLPRLPAPRTPAGPVPGDRSLLAPPGAPGRAHPGCLRQPRQRRPGTPVAPARHARARCAEKARQRRAGTGGRGRTGQDQQPPDSAAPALCRSAGHLGRIRRADDRSSWSTPTAPSNRVYARSRPCC